MPFPKMMRSLASLLDKLSAVVRRDLLTACRYRSGLILGVAGGFLEIAGLYFLSHAIGPGFRPDGMDSYPFLLVGTGLYTLFMMGVSAFVSTIQEAQRAGTLEVLMTTPTDGSAVLLLSALSSLAGKALTFSIYLAGGLVLAGVRLGHVSLLPATVVLLLALVLATALGMGMAAVQLLTQKASAILWLLGSAAWIFAGAMFPISALPRGLQFVSLALPMTHPLSAMRLALFGGGPPTGLVNEIKVLGAFAVLLLPLSLWFFENALRQARLSGSLSYY